MKKYLSVIVMLFCALTLCAEPFTYDLGFDADAWLASQEAASSDFAFAQPMASHQAADNLSLDYKNTVGRPNTFWEDISWAGMPLFVAGIIAKSEKKSFRQDYKNTHANTRLVTDFHTEIDNYTQFLPFAASTILNFSGYKGRSNTWRYLTSSALSFAFMGIFVNSIKYTASEMRPDGTTANSWPSGHTATAFTAATILHKEYGMTVSPWFSVGGYTVATATGVMRVLNNRHWVSDILSGAGLGILAGELGYAFSDLIFKDWGINRFDKNVRPSLIDNPSFFDIQMGIGFGSRNLDFDYLDYAGENIPVNVRLKFRNSTVLGVEGAYFFNPYIGVGGRFRVRTTPIGNFSEIAQSEQNEFNRTLADVKEEVTKEYAMYAADLDKNFNTWVDQEDMLLITLESDHMTEFTADLGLYFSYPFGDHWAIGTKALVGRSICDELDINARSTSRKLDIDWNTVNQDVLGFTLSDDATTYEWDYLTVGANNTMKFGTGLSLTYAYKSNFSFKVFADYDYARKTFTATYNPSPLEFYQNLYGNDLYEMSFNDPDDPINVEEYKSHTSTVKRGVNHFTLGGSFTVSF